MKSRRITDVKDLMHLWQVENLFLAGQPTPQSVDDIKKLGVDKVFNLRGEGELDFSWEPDAFKSVGIDYEQFPIITAQGLDADNCERLSQGIEEGKNYFIHCGTANRVGAWLITYLVKFKGMDFEDAVNLASESGLTNPAFVEQAQQVLQKIG